MYIGTLYLTEQEIEEFAKAGITLQDLVESGLEVKPASDFVSPLTQAVENAKSRKKFLGLF